MGGRGLLLEWRRELQKKLHINWYLPRQSRGASLVIMAQWTNAQDEDQGLTGRLFVTATMEMPSPPGLSIARLVPRQRKPYKDCLLHGPGVWAGVPQLVVFNLPCQPHLPPLLTCQNLHPLNP